ncbi:hypothetical protein BDN72DRAFT_549926 [Pluteus cervinus]|uniref:Uncharacterized protein n=1 Tax=Pluteus cervinus TaxID=181527 RepID=A0ACD3A404_9AGAR|nr:hypothetical protein BDN72DRAFT_549926 [Pluteus cervinus]
MLLKAVDMATAYLELPTNQAVSIPHPLVIPECSPTMRRDFVYRRILVKGRPRDNKGSPAARLTRVSDPFNNEQTTNECWPKRMAYTSLCSVCDTRRRREDPRGLLSILQRAFNLRVYKYVTHHNHPTPTVIAGTIRYDKLDVCISWVRCNW